MNSKGLEDDENLNIVAEMLSKCQINEQKPWPDFVHASASNQNSPGIPNLIATLDICPFPASSTLIPFPFFTVDQKNNKLEEVLFNKAVGLCASIPLFAPIPILLPPLAAMLTGNPSKILSLNMKTQQERFVSIFKKLYEAAENKEEFLQSKQAKKIRFMHQELGMKIRSHERFLRRFQVQSWKPVQSSVTIFVFYSKIMDIIRQTNAFTPEENAGESERYAELIKKADRQTGILKCSQIEDIDFGGFKHTKEAAINFLKTNNSFLKDPQTFIPLLEKRMNASVWENDGQDVMDFEKEAAFFVREFTIKVLEKMEKWILIVSGIPHQFHDAISLKKQPFPIGANVDSELLKELHQQLAYIHRIRVDAYSNFWINSSMKPVLILPEDSKIVSKKEKRRFLLELFEAFTRTQTSYETITNHVLQQYEIVNRRVNPSDFTSSISRDVKLYLDSPSRRQPLSIFSSV